MPTLKERKRYLVFEIISEENIGNFSSVSNAIWGKTKDFIGELGLARAGMWLLPDKWDSKKQMGIIKVNNKYVDEIKASLTLVKKIDDQEVIIRSRGVSGILKKAENKFMAG